jgi:hypothetical protein
MSSMPSTTSTTQTSSGFSNPRTGHPDDQEPKLCNLPNP